MSWLRRLLRRVFGPCQCEHCEVVRDWELEKLMRGGRLR